MKSRTVATVLVVALLIGAGSVYVIAGRGLTRAASATSLSSTTSVTLDPASQVKAAFMSYLQVVAAGNVTTVLGQYASNATMVYTIPTPTGPRPDTATGSSQIETLYDQNVFYRHTVSFANESFAASVSSDEVQATINANLTVYGTSIDALPSNQNGVYVSNAVLTVQFVRLGDSWLITQETWDNVNAVDGCQTYSSPGCSLLMSSPNWSSSIGQLP